MKKFHIIYIIFFFIVICKPDGFAHNRYQWWKIRMQKLANEKIQLLSNNKIDGSVIDLIDNEIKRVKKIISVFERNIHSDNSINHKSRKYSRSEIEDQIDKIFIPIFSIYYFEKLVIETGKKDNISFARKAVKGQINKIIKRRFKRNGEELADIIIEKDISPNNWKSLSMEIFICRLIKNKNQIMTRVRADITADVLEVLSGSNFITDYIELNKLVVDSTIDHLNSYSIDDNLRFSNDLFELSWCWKRIYSELDRDFAGYQKIISLLKKSGSVSFNRIRYYYKNPSILKSILKDNVDMADSAPGIESKHIVNSYRYQIKRNRDYLLFINQLVKDSSEDSSFYSPYIQKKFAVSIRRLDNIFRFIGYSLSLEKKYLSLLNKKQFDLIMDLKTGFIGKIKLSRKDLSRYYISYFNQKARNAKKRKRARENLKEKIAYYEIDILKKNADEYAMLYDSYKYAERALTGYTVKFDELQEEARSGEVSQSLKESIKMMSLFLSIEDFDRNRIIKEYVNKEYLKREGRIAISRLIAVLRYYRRKNVKIKNYPASEEIEKIRKILSRKVGVKISGWQMNEVNFDQVDKKAAAKLTIMLKRMIWRGKSDNKKKKMKGDSLYVKIDSSGISFTIPQGWIEDQPKKTDQLRGVVKSFSSIDNASTIRLVKIALNNKDVKEISEIWLKKKGNRMIKERWGKKEKFEYFWTLAKDNESNILETYTVSKDGYALIISGRTKRDKYRYFKEKLNSIFDSLKF